MSQESNTEATEITTVDGETQEVGEGEGQIVEETKVEGANKTPAPEEDEWAMRLALVARKDREVSRKIDEVERRFQQVSNLENKYHMYHTLEEAVKARDASRILKSFSQAGIDPTELYTTLTHQVINGDLTIPEDTGKGPAPEYKQEIEELKQQLMATQQYLQAQQEAQVAQAADTYVSNNAEKFPLLARNSVPDRGLQIWKVYQNSFNLDPTITLDQVCDQIEKEIVAELSSKEELFALINNKNKDLPTTQDNSITKTPKTISTITNKASTPQTTRSLQDKLANVHSLDKRAEIIAEHYRNSK